jgi:threonine dehydratase
VTKLATTLAVLVAVEEGVLELDAPAGPEGSTVRHLLAHAAGLPFDAGPPIARPATRRVYSNYGFEVAAALVEERGLTLVPPFDHLLIMAGQGTAALELLEEQPQLDALLVPVGGGGLIAGCATAAKALVPGIRVVGVEPEASDDTRRSLEAGRRVRIPVPRTIADGQQADIPGELTFAVNRQVVDTIVTVTDSEIVAAMAFLFDRMKLVTEPSGASAAAALLAGHVPDAAGARIGVVISGGNVGAARFAELMAAR